jgi:hypothetical protein
MHDDLAITTIRYPGPSDVDLNRTLAAGTRIAPRSVRSRDDRASLACTLVREPNAAAAFPPPLPFPTIQPPLAQTTGSDYPVAPYAVTVQSPLVEVSSWRTVAILAFVSLLGVIAATTILLRGGWMRVTPTSTHATTAASPMPRPARGGISALPGHSGVVMIVDGESRGMLPLTLSNLPVGEHTVRFEAGERFRSIERTIVVVDNDVLDLGRIELELIEGSVTVNITDAAAQVWLRSDDRAAKVVGPWPKVLLLAPGDYELIVARYGYRAQVRPLHIDAADAEQTVEVRLRPTTWLKDDPLEL